MRFGSQSESDPLVPSLPEQTCVRRRREVQYISVTFSVHTHYHTHTHTHTGDVEPTG